MIPDLDHLRADLTEHQRSILDHVWQTYYQHNGNTWPRVQDVQVDFEKPRVLASLDALPPGTVFVENDRYMIGLLGVLLTTQGVLVERLLSDYLAYLCEDVRKLRKTQQVPTVIKSADVATALKLPDKHMPILGSAIHLARLDGDRGVGGPVWAAGIPREIPDIMLVPDLSAYVRDRAIRLTNELAAVRGVTSTQQPAFWFVHSSELRALLDGDYAELSRVHPVGASKSVVLLAGGVLEAMLLDVLSSDEPRAKAMFHNLRSRTAGPLERWDLVDLVEVAWKMDILPEPARHLSQALRQFRNLVHPGKCLRDQIVLTESEADISIHILDICIRAVSAYERRRIDAGSV